MTPEDLKALLAALPVQTLEYAPVENSRNALPVTARGVQERDALRSGSDGIAWHMPIAAATSLGPNAMYNLYNAGGQPFDYDPYRTYADVHRSVGAPGGAVSGFVADLITPDAGDALGPGLNLLPFGRALMRKGVTHSPRNARGSGVEGFIEDAQALFGNKPQQKRNTQSFWASGDGAKAAVNANRRTGEVDISHVQADSPAKLRELGPLLDLLDLHEVPAKTRQLKRGRSDTLRRLGFERGENGWFTRQPLPREWTARQSEYGRRAARDMWGDYGSVQAADVTPDVTAGVVERMSMSGEDELMAWLTKAQEAGLAPGQLMASLERFGVDPSVARGLIEKTPAVLRR